MTPIQYFIKVYPILYKYFKFRDVTITMDISDTIIDIFNFLFVFKTWSLVCFILPHQKKTNHSMSEKPLLGI